MSNMKNFDSFLKEGFSDYSPEVAPHIWEKIVAEREKRKPKGFWWSFRNQKGWLIVAALLLAGAAATRKLGGHFSGSTATTGKTTSLPVDNSNITQPTIAADNNGTDENKITAGPDKAASTADAGSKNKNSLLHDGAPEQPLVPVPHPGNKNDKGLHPSIQSGSLVNNQQDHSSTKNVVFTKSKKVRLNRKGRPVFSTSSVAPSEDVTDNNQVSPAIDDKPEAGNDNAGYSNNPSSISRLLYPFSKLTILPADEKAINKVVVKTVPLPGCPTIEKNAAINKKYFDLYAGPDIGLISYTDTPNSVYLQRRKESTRFLSAFSAGARYTRVFKNGMSFRTGINYSQINEKFTYIQSNIVQVTYIIDPISGDTTGSYTVTGSRNKTTYNHYRSVDLPLMIGYEWGNDRLRMNINAGAMINLYSWQKGDVLDTSFKPVSITTGKAIAPYQYKTNFGVGVSVAASVYYKLNDQLYLLAEPYFRYNFSPMNKENLTLRQKYSTLGLRLGIRWDLQ